jgi:Enoyl-(Acyl carrier protein) reductase
MPVNAIEPTVVKTEGLVARTPLGGPPVDELIKLVVSQQTIKRASTPMDAVNALSFHVSEDAGFITGQILRVDGGFSRSGASDAIRLGRDISELTRLVETYEYGSIPSPGVRSNNEDHSILGH